MVSIRTDDALSSSTECGWARNWSRRCTTTTTLGDRFEHQRPVERRVAAADDDDVLPLIHGGIGHEMDQAAAEVLTARRQGPRGEGADAAGDDDGAALDAIAGRRRDREGAITAFEPHRLLTEQIVRRERRGLFESCSTRSRPRMAGKPATSKIDFSGYIAVIWPPGSSSESSTAVESVRTPA